MSVYTLYCTGNKNKVELTIFNWISDSIKPKQSWIKHEYCSPLNLQLCKTVGIEQKIWWIFVTKSKWNKNMIRLAFT